jgi:uncharacterized protein (TIGR00725 family)
MTPAPIVAVFGSSATLPDHADWEEAHRCGALLAAAGLTVATGGYGGIMEAVSAGAASAGGHVIGVTAPVVFPDRAGANSHVLEERVAATLPQRVARLIEDSAAVIALPGSIGTLTELVVAWNTAFVTRFSGSTPRPVVAVGDTWSRLVAHITSELATDAGIVRCVADVDAAVATVVSALE